MNVAKWTALATACFSFTANAQDIAPANVPNAEAVPVVQPEAPSVKALLPAGTPVIVTLDQDISTKENKLGDNFGVTVLYDVLHNDAIAIPKGTKGRGELTFVSKKGSFGKPGIIGISLRELDFGGKQYILDGRYREEGGHNSGGAATAVFAVGILGGLVVTGKTGAIPQGRELKARTGEDISYTLVPPPAPAADQTVPSQSENAGAPEAAPLVQPTGTP
jgi:hypothetical protein